MTQAKPLLSLALLFCLTPRDWCEQILCTHRRVWSRETTPYPANWAACCMLQPSSLSWGSVACKLKWLCLSALCLNSSVCPSHPGHAFPSSPAPSGFQCFSGLSHDVPKAPPADSRCFSSGPIVWKLLPPGPSSPASLVLLCTCAPMGASPKDRASRTKSCAAKHSRESCLTCTAFDLLKRCLTFSRS